ncbi:hypothetical protein ABZ297_44855 [Nonomuraea sp. NPDC005983]|uniref:hypothetical protein n=1 Tax=Nonomuraea sp. NPDC005983 TaxID=3155595 RepID=UPI0033ABB7DD
MSTELHVQRIRVYFDAASGEIVHVHQLVTETDEPLTEQRMDEEMAALEEVLRRRHPAALDYLVVDEAAIAEAVAPDVNLRVDVEARVLLRS